MRPAIYSVGLFVIFACSLNVVLPAGAQDVLVERQISVSQARDAALAALERCRADGFRVSVAVVDRAGNLKALLRDDDTGPHTVESSRRKAFTAASLRTSTGELANRVAGDPSLADLRNLTDGLLFLGGGLPIPSGTEVIGGIGVGGAPSGQADEACAQAGIDGIAATPEPAG
ncbi:MAG: heme-binding protein [Syntrophobacteraceae bacterium]